MVSPSLYRTSVVPPSTARILTGNMGTGIAGEHQGRADDIFLLAPAVLWYVGNFFLVYRFVATGVFGHGGKEAPGGQRVYANMILGQHHGKVAGELMDGRLAGGVAQGIGGADDAGDGAYVDDACGIFGTRAGA